MLKRFGGNGGSGCGCEHSLEGTTLHVDATECDGDGNLVEHPGCRRTVITQLGGNRADRIRVETGGLVRWYESGARISSGRRGGSPNGSTLGTNDWPPPRAGTRYTPPPRR